jgi:hypothetical protein
MRKQRLFEDLATRRQPGRWSAPNLASSPPAGRPRDVAATAVGIRERGDIDLAGAERDGADRAGVESVGLESVGLESVGLESVVEPVEVASVGVASVGMDSVRAERVEAERIEAERLIDDVAALVDAGLVVVESGILGPARYAVGPDLEDAA